MPYLRHTIKTKGFSKTLKRPIDLLHRYGLSFKRMKFNISEFIDLKSKKVHI